MKVNKYVYIYLTITEAKRLNMWGMHGSIQESAFLDKQVHDILLESHTELKRLHHKPLK